MSHVLKNMITLALLFLTIMYTLGYINESYESYESYEVYNNVYTYTFLSTPRTDCEWQNAFETNMQQFWSQSSTSVKSIRVISDKNVHNKSGWLIGTGLRICAEHCFVMQYTSTHTWNAFEWSAESYAMTVNDITLSRYPSVTSMIEFILRNNDALHQMFWCHHLPLAITK